MRSNYEDQVFRRLLLGVGQLSLGSKAPPTTVIATGPGHLTGWIFLNRGGGAAEVFVKFYDTASAINPAVNVPFLTLPLAVGQREALSGFMIPFDTGLSVRVTLLIADNDATAVPSANQISAVVFFRGG